MNDNSPIIVALDVPTLDEAGQLASDLRDEVGFFKVGLELFVEYGPRVVHEVRQFGRVFLDLKLHDIPTTVERTTAQLSSMDLDLVTVHAFGGPRMIEAAVRGLNGAGQILAVTVLTSTSDDELAAMNIPSAAREVLDLARLATEAGAPGLVCSPMDLVEVRTAVGEDVLLVTPGVRPPGAREDDHARPATPAQAMKNGANLLVIGRPITRAPSPIQAAREIRASIQSFCTP